jgi:hypothetical protein
LGGPGSDLGALVIGGVEQNQLQALPELLPRYPPGLAIYAGDLQANYTSRQVHSILRGQEVELQRGLAGMSLDLGKGRSCGF